MLKKAACSSGGLLCFTSDLAPLATGRPHSQFQRHSSHTPGEYNDPIKLSSNLNRHDPLAGLVFVGAQNWDLDQQIQEDILGGFYGLAPSADRLKGEPPGADTRGTLADRHLLLLPTRLVVGPVHDVVRGAGLGGRGESRASRHGDFPSLSTTRTDFPILAGSRGGLPRAIGTLAHELLLLRQRDGADFYRWVKAPSCLLDLVEKFYCGYKA
jgi:hypothetical protein